MNRTPDPLESTPAQSKEAKIATLVQARRADLTLREAAKLAGVHVATVCRWQARDPALRKALVEAEREAKRHRYLLASRPSPPGSLAPRMPGMQGESRCTVGRPLVAVLAVRPLALVHVGELAAAGPSGLPPLRGCVLLVTQPQEHQLQRLRDANFCTLTWHLKRGENSRNTGLGSLFCRVKWANPGPKTTQMCAPICSCLRSSLSAQLIMAQGELAREQFVEFTFC